MACVHTVWVYVCESSSSQCSWCVWAAGGWLIAEKRGKDALGQCALTCNQLSVHPQSFVYSVRPHTHKQSRHPPSHTGARVWGRVSGSATHDGVNQHTNARTDGCSQHVSTCKPTIQPAPPYRYTPFSTDSTRLSFLPSTASHLGLQRSTPSWTYSSSLHKAARRQAAASNGGTT